MFRNSTLKVGKPIYKCDIMYIYVMYIYIYIMYMNIMYNICMCVDIICQISIYLYGE